MTQAFVIAFLCGGALGMRYRFLVLIPAFLAVSLIIVGVGMARHEGALAVILTLAVGAIGLQAGYLAGCLAGVLEGAWHAGEQPTEPNGAQVVQFRVQQPRYPARSQP